VSIASTAAPASNSTGQRRHLRLLVGVQDGTLSGVNTYVEHIAAAAATAIDDVTLLVADEGLAAELGQRYGSNVRIVPIGLARPTPGQRRIERISPGYAARRLTAALVAARPRIGEGFDAAHLNHPHLAATARPLARLVFVAAWYYPHSMTARVISTWQHSGRRFPRSAGLALKGTLHHRNDARGYRSADTIVAPTRALAEQLRRAGLDAVHSTPPASLLAAPGSGVLPERRDRPEPRLLVCSGDLGHPRKNVGLAIDAIALLGASGVPMELELVGGNAASLDRRLSRLPASVRVTASGRLPAAEVHQRMRAADLLLFPSLFEEWGYVAAEAALQGTAVVTLPVYPFQEMLEPPLGFSAAGLHPADYAEAITRALASEASRAEVAERAEQRFGLESAGRRLAALWGGDPLTTAPGAHR